MSQSFSVCPLPPSACSVMYSASTPPVEEMPTVTVKRDRLRGLPSSRCDRCPSGARPPRRYVDEPSTCDSSHETKADIGNRSIRRAHRTRRLSLRSL